MISIKGIVIACLACVLVVFGVFLIGTFIKFVVKSEVEERAQIAEQYRCPPGEVLVKTITTSEQTSSAACIPGHYK